jgi:hypothetical protein
MSAKEVSSITAWCICPICGKKGWAFYPYDDFVLKHKHPLRRHIYRIRTGSNYAIWFNDYLRRLEKVKNLYANL